MSWNIKRQETYTKDGLLRKMCIRCGERASKQWQICSDGNNFRPICRSCDTSLQKVVLKFMKHPNMNQLLKEYEKEISHEEDYKLG